MAAPVPPLASAAPAGPAPSRRSAPPAATDEPLTVEGTPRPLRWLWMGLGLLFVGLGSLGTVVPLLPTTPFLLLAAACFARGSDRFLAWLLAHPVFGSTIRAWRARRALPPGVKSKAIPLVIVTILISAWMLPHPAGRASCAVVGVGLVVFLARLPVWDEAESAPP